MAITPLPTAPSRSDPGNFTARADAFMAALPTFANEANALQTDVNEKQVTANAAADTATTQATNASASSAAAAISANNAAASTGAVLWVSGTTYALGFYVRSPANARIYRKLTASSSTTIDPSADVTNYTPVFLDISSGYPTIQPSLNLDFANTKQLDPRITFVRNSTATYYDGQTTALAEQNLMTSSISVGGAGWAVVSITTTINAGIAPDNTTTASLLTASAGSGVPRTVHNVTGAANIVYTCSIYAKAGTFNILQIYDGSGSDNRWANFDLTSGTLGTYGNCVSSIISIGNGWYRCIVTYTSVSTTITNVFVMAATSSSGRAAGLTAIGTESWYLWGAQVENRSAATAYTPTTTSAITNYIPVLMTAPAGVARFDCDPITGKSLGLLIEESRTNLFTYSSDFSNAAWAKGATVLYYNQLIAPDGTLTATLIGTASSVLPYYYGINWVSGISYTYSIFVKPVTGTTISFRMNNLDSVGDQKWTFNSTTGVITKNSGIATATSTVTNIGNSWYRLSFTSTANQSATGYVSFESGTGFAVWGAQLEAGAVPTSYIATVASTVTRAADVASMTGANFSSWYNQAQGSFFVAYNGGRDALQAGYGRVLASGTTATSNSFISSNGSKNSINSYNGSVATSLTVANADFWGVGGKAAMSYSTTSTILSGNGFSNTNNTLPTWSTKTVITLGIGGAQQMNGHISKILYYPVALSSSNLVALTS